MDCGSGSSHQMCEKSLNYRTARPIIESRESESRAANVHGVYLPLLQVSDPGGGNFSSEAKIVEKSADHERAGSQSRR